MAKSRKSRRERRLANEKSQTQDPSSPSSTITASAQTPKAIQSPKSNGVGNKTISLAHEYQYVYTEIRNIVIITVVMFAVLFGLSNFI